MGQVIQFPRNLLPPEQSQIVQVSVKDLLSFKLPDSFMEDEDTGEIVADNVTIDLVAQYLRLFGLHLTGIVQVADFLAIWDEVEHYRFQATFYSENPRLWELSSGHNGKEWQAYVRAIAAGDLAATKAYADKNHLRTALLAAGKNE